MMRKIFSVVLEEGGGFVEVADEDAGVLAGGFEKIGRQFGDLESAVVFGRVDVVGGLVIVEEEGHVAGHLAGGEIAAEEEVCGEGLAFDGAAGEFEGGEGRFLVFGEGLL